MSNDIISDIIDGYVPEPPPDPRGLNGGKHPTTLLHEEVVRRVNEAPLVRDQHGNVVGYAWVKVRRSSKGKVVSTHQYMRERGLESTTRDLTVYVRRPLVTSD